MRHLISSPDAGAPGLASLLILLGILSLSMVTDLRSRRVPNAIIIVGALLLIVASWAAGSASTMQSVLGLSLALLIGVPVFAAGWFGGGDVKLLALVGIALGPVYLLFTLPWILIAGGAVTLLSRRSNGVPYAVAILAGVLIEQLRLTLIGGFYDLA